MQLRSWDECERLLTAPGSPWELEDAVVNGRKMKQWKNTPPHFRSFLLARLTTHAHRVMLSSPTPDPAPFHAREHVTFGEIHARALKLAAWLRGYGVRQGSRVAIGGANSTGWVVAFVAVHLLGGVPVLLNSTLVVTAQIHCLAKTAPSIVLVDAALAQVLAPVSAELTTKGVGEVYCWSSLAHLDDSVRRNVKELVDPSPPQHLIQDVIDGKDLENLTLDADGTIFFTSGTTSMPKAVLGTQRSGVHSVLSAQVGGARWALRQGKTLKDIPFPPPPASVLMVVPLFHVTGCLSQLLRAFNTGSKMVFTRKWRVEDAIRLISEEDVNVFGGVPAIIVAMLQSPLLPPSVQFASMSYGGAPSAERLAGDIVRRFPNCVITHGYGASETAAVHTSLSGGDFTTHPSSVGRPLPGCEMRVVHPETRKVLGQGEMGIIELRGMTVMKEYYNDPEATRAALDDDHWLHTGDMGLIDAEGLLYIRDRAKDIIIRGGENIASAEVESAIALDNRVAEVAAVPVPCTLMGERVGVAVTLAPGASATEKEILAAVAPRLRYPARPVIVVVSETPLPRNANGKILKHEVRSFVREVWEREARAKEFAVAPKEVRAKL